MLRAAAVLLIASATFGQEVGSRAPSLDGVAWVNLGKGKAPKTKGFKGKVLLVQFWASNNFHSTMSFSGLQDLQELGLGVEIATIAIDEEKKLKDFLAKEDYTVLVGSDPGKVVSGTWGVKGWPRVFLVDRKGKIVWIGDPYGAQKEAWKILGVTIDPKELLTTLRDKRKDKKTVATCLEMLRVYGVVEFDLEKFADELKRDPPPADSVIVKKEPAAALSDYVDGLPLSDHALKASATKKFNLRAWARDRYYASYPVKAGTLKKLLAARRYRTALEALAVAPSASLVSAAASNKDFARYCLGASEQRLVFARKALMIYTWPLQKRVPKDNDAFWSDVSIQAWQENEDKSMAGVRIGSEYVLGPEMQAYAKRCVAQHMLMDRIGNRKGGLPGDFEKKVEAEVARLLKELEAKYG